MPLKWTSPDGVKVTKTLVFRRGSYRIDLEYTIENAQRRALASPPYVQILHDRPAGRALVLQRRQLCVHGPALLGRHQVPEAEGHRQAEDASLNREITGGWLASLQHHFVAAIVPAQSRSRIATR